MRYLFTDDVKALVEECSANAANVTVKTSTDYGLGLLTYTVYLGTVEIGKYTVNAPAETSATTFQKDAAKVDEIIQTAHNISALVCAAHSAGYNLRAAEEAETRKKADTEMSDLIERL